MTKGFSSVTGGIGLVVAVVAGAVGYSAISGNGLCSLTGSKACSTEAAAVNVANTTHTGGCCPGEKDASGPEATLVALEGVSSECATACEGEVPGHFSGNGKSGHFDGNGKSDCATACAEVCPAMADGCTEAQKAACDTPCAEKAGGVTAEPVALETQADAPACPLCPSSKTADASTSSERDDG